MDARITVADIATEMVYVSSFPKHPIVMLSLVNKFRDDDVRQAELSIGEALSIGHALIEAALERLRD